MTSTFNVHEAAGYEQLMGRWSRRLAPLFIDFAGLRDGERVLDVGCGTGSLTFALPRQPNSARSLRSTIRPSSSRRRRRNTDPRIKIDRRTPARCHSRTAGSTVRMALLVLHFVPEAGKAVAEMRRVVRPGGVVAAVVWDHLGGMPGMRMMMDTVAVLGEAGRQMRGRYCFQPMMRPGEMKQSFVSKGSRASAKQS